MMPAPRITVWVGVLAMLVRECDGRSADEWWRAGAGSDCPPGIYVRGQAASSCAAASVKQNIIRSVPATGVVKGAKPHIAMTSARTPRTLNADPHQRHRQEKKKGGSARDEAFSGAHYFSRSRAAVPVPLHLRPPFAIEPPPMAAAGKVIIVTGASRGTPSALSPCMWPAVC